MGTVHQLSMTRFHNLRSRTIHWILVLAMVLYSNAAIAAEQCALNGRTITATISLWGPEKPLQSNASENWEMATIRLQFIGDKILFYGDPNDPTGIVYHLGRAVDMSLDPLQSKDLIKQMPHVRRQYLVAASNDGLDVRLQYHERMSVENTNTVVLALDQNIRIFVASCNACTVVEFDRIAHSVKPDHDFNDHLVDESCLIN